MRIGFGLTAAALVFLGAPALAQTTSGDAMKKAPSAQHTTTANDTSTTPSVNRPGDADVKASNKNGGTGGKNSSANGG